MSERRPKDAVDWGLLHTLNERCLERMVQLARSGQEHAPPAISSNRALWCDLHAAALKRAANCRLLLLDINFADPAWWLEAAATRPIQRGASDAGYAQPAFALELTRETMTLAWIVARADQCQATIFCGMAPRVARLFSSFSPSDLERHSARHHQHLRLRFDDQPTYWRMHLRVSSRTPSSEAPHLQGDLHHSLV
jgi:hypothetical protein